MTEALYRLREATENDVAAIAAIYSHHVRFGLGTFEEEPPSDEEMDRRRRDVLGRGMPFVVAEGGDTICGYAYAAPYRPRSAYRFVLEDSIYVAPQSLRRGIGSVLLGDLIRRGTETGFRQMVAVIGDSGNASSIGLHERMGFRRVGFMPGIGFKHGRWIDSVLMQRVLGSGDTAPP